MCVCCVSTLCRPMHIYLQVQLYIDKKWKYILNICNYCKSGNIRGALIFANFAQNSASANSKTRENICDILYAHFGHVPVGAVYGPCVLMQLGDILENV